MCVGKDEARGQPMKTREVRSLCTIEHETLASSDLLEVEIIYQYDDPQTFSADTSHRQS